jgi:hypothetical protein
MIKQKEHVPTLREIYPNFSDEELAEVGERIDRHIRIVMDIYDRIYANPVEYAELKEALAKPRNPTNNCRGLA